MISAGSAVSDSRTAPSTDCSASRFCGGATGPRPFVYPLVSACALIGRSSLGCHWGRTAREHTFCPHAPGFGGWLRARLPQTRVVIYAGPPGFLRHESLSTRDRPLWQVEPG